MPLPEFSGTLGSKRAAHLLRRATFGPTRSQVDSFSMLTAGQAVDQLLRQTLPDPAPPVDPDTLEPWVLSGITDPDKMDGEYQEYFKAWFVGQMMAVGVSPASGSAYSAREKVVFFLHTHFTAIQEKIGSSRALYFQNQLFRLYARDALASPLVPDAVLNFRELSKKISVDNAMLRLLDGNLNVNGSPNENYARELLELYAIGRGLENALPPPTGEGDYIFYTETDVQEAARVLSGFDFDDTFSTIDPDTLLPRGAVRGDALNASAHDNEPKQFSSRFVDTGTGQPYIITPDPLLQNNGDATEASALDEISQLVDMIYSRDETARHICRKLYRFYVHHEITDAINNSVIAIMADHFRSGGYKLQPVIENLLRSQHFYDAGAGVDDDNFGGIIKSPLDLVTGALRFFEYSLPDYSSSPQTFYEQAGEILNHVGNQGMNFYQPFDVAGYDAYHQYPIYHRSWITVNYLTSRYAFIRGLFGASEPGMLKINPYEFVRNTIDNTLAANARNLVIELCRYLLPLNDNLTFDTASDDNASLTAERLNFFLTSFLSDIDPDPEAAWTDRWTNQNGVPTMTSQLENLFNALMQSPEYQLQ